jgi:phosphoenolpyruvate phosphomutase
MKPGIANDFRSLLQQPKTQFLMEVHDGISTRVAQSTGFWGLWASSFACSTALGLPDNDSSSIDDIAAYLKPILRSSCVPVLVDGNCGFGSPEASTPFLRSLVELGAAGVCLEDKQYPKSNTFYAPSHPLCDADRYCELISKARQTCAYEDLVLVARTEALVSERGIDEAIRRCELYCEAGAEAIFISWISEDIDTLQLFLSRWNGRAPLVLNPTSYLKSLMPLLSMPGVSLVVWANQNIRACVKAMSSLCRALLNVEARGEEALSEIDSNISSMADIFNLIGYYGGPR